MRRRPTALLLVVSLLAVMTTAERCKQDDVRKQLWKWKNKAGKVLKAAEENWNDFYVAETDRLGDELLEAHKDDPGWDEETAVAEFEEAILELDEHDERFQKARMATAESLEAFEEALDAWKHIKDPDLATIQKVVETGRDLIRGLEDISAALIKCRVEVPNLLDTVVAGLGKILDMIASEPDPDEV
jgi:hypothetical protein